MGTSAQVQSLRTQLAAKDAANAALQQRIDELVDGIDRLETDLEEARAELKTNEAIAERILPVVDAALQLTGMDPNKPMWDATVVDPKDMIEVRADYHMAMVEALANLEKFVVKHVMPSEVGTMAAKGA